MATISLILASIAGLGMLACWIMTLIKMFQNEKPLIAILGILCGLWAFIWGWMNAAKHNHKKIMLIWTVCWVVYMIFAASAGMFSMSFTTGGV
ncbi:MAG: hypothetical protein AB8F34_06225 [Akkermansiaceae bacterium]